MKDITSGGSLGEGRKRIGVMSMEVVTPSLSNGDL